MLCGEYTVNSMALIMDKISVHLKKVINIIFDGTLQTETLIF